ISWTLGKLNATGLTASTYLHLGFYDHNACTQLLFRLFCLRRRVSGDATKYRYVLLLIQVTSLVLVKVHSETPFSSVMGFNQNHSVLEIASQYLHFGQKDSRDCEEHFTHFAAIERRGLSPINLLGVQLR